MKKMCLLLSLLLLVLYNISAQIPTNGLIAFYPFNGNANDESGNGMNGYVYGASAVADRFGNQNSAYSFNGISNYIWLGENQTFNPKNISICCWFKTTNKENGMALIRWRNYGYSMSFRNPHSIPDSSLYINCFVNNSNCYVLKNNNTIYTDGNWHFAVLTFDSITAKMFVDNRLIASSNQFQKSSIYYGSGGMAIGRDGDYSGYYYKGNIDDIRIYNRPLKEYELSALYYEGICKQSVSVTDTLVINLNVTNFNPITYQYNIKVYPNPTKNYLIIDFGKNFGKMINWHVKITNSAGQAVCESAINEQTKNINFNAWTGVGTYLINLIDNNGNLIESKKVILQ